MRFSSLDSQLCSFGILFGGFEVDFFEHRFQLFSCSLHLCRCPFSSCHKEGFQVIQVFEDADGDRWLFFDEANCVFVFEREIIELDLSAGVLFREGCKW